MMRRVLIVLENGPDIRQFVHSGLAADLAREAETAWALGHRASAGQLPEGHERVALSEIVPALPRTLKLMSRLAERACNAREEHRSGQAGWVNFLDTLRSRRTSPMKQRLDALLARPPVHRALVALEQGLCRGCPLPARPRARLNALKPDTIVLSGHATAAACGLLWLAGRSGVRTVVMQNSWKDAYARPHVAVAPDLFIVPSAEAADLLVRANPSLTAEILVRDTLHTTQLAEPSSILPRGPFCARHGLDPARPIICLSAAAPNAVHGEPEIVSALVSGLEDTPQILIRLNPMEDDPARWADLARRPDIVLQTPDWDYVADEKWSAPRLEDASVWASTIAHSAFNISVPSTVTRDFLLFEKPVINICFDGRPPASAKESTRRYWDAPFYEPYRDCPAITPAFSIEDLVEVTRQHLARATPCSSRPDPGLAARARALGRAAILGEEA